MSIYHYCALNLKDADDKVEDIIEERHREGLTDDEFKEAEFGYLHDYADGEELFDIPLSDSTGISLGFLDLNDEEQKRKFEKLINDYGHVLMFIFSDGKIAEHDEYSDMLESGAFEKKFGALQYAEFFEVEIDD